MRLGDEMDRRRDEDGETSLGYQEARKIASSMTVTSVGTRHAKATQRRARSLKPVGGEGGGGGPP